MPHDITTEEVWGTCQHLQQLTHLELHNRHSSLSGCTARISKLTKLQELGLLEAKRQASPDHDRFDGVQQLQRLTQLKIGGYWNIMDILSHSASSLGRLTGLHKITLTHCNVQLDALSAVTGLGAITLEHVYSSAASLLVWLQLQQQLTSLCLKGSVFSAQPLPEDDVAAFSAMTASTNLRVLDLHHLRGELPKAAWQHLFPANRVLQQLTSLQAPDAWLSHGCALLDAADAAALARCCPALQVCVRCAHALMHHMVGTRADDHVTVHAYARNAMHADKICPFHALPMAPARNGWDTWMVSRLVFNIGAPWGPLVSLRTRNLVPVQANLNAVCKVCALTSLKRPGLWGPKHA